MAKHGKHGIVDPASKKHMQSFAGGGAIAAGVGAAAVGAGVKPKKKRMTREQAAKQTRKDLGMGS